jgi:hydroxymethylglutaryl-CoA lyase
MSDLPSFVEIREEGPREGFQIEAGPIATTRKAELIDALSQTGVTEIQAVSFVNPKRVPGMADAEDVLQLISPNPKVRYTALCLNAKGVERAVAHEVLDLYGSLITSASEPFLQQNQNIDFQANLDIQRDMMAVYRRHDLPVERIALMAAFGCNFKGDVSIKDVHESLRSMMLLAEELDLNPQIISLADTMAWATPASVKRVVGSVREKYPDHRLVLHLHDTRGMGIANAYAGLQMGVDMFDTAAGGLGGCPFAAHKGAAGNVCTEDLVFLLQEMGIDTGIDLEAMIRAGRLAEDIVGHALPGAVKVGGSLRALRATNA